MADRNNPREVVGLDRHANGVIDYVHFEQSNGPERKIKIDGAHYEHCAEDGDGVWLYRYVDF